MNFYSFILVLWSSLALLKRNQISNSTITNVFLCRYVSDALAPETLDPNALESIRDEEEEAVEEQKDEGKLGFCEIQWQQKSPFIDARKFTKKNFKHLDNSATNKLSLSITKIDEDDDRVEIIPLTSPMKVRSPLGYRSSYNVVDENPKNLGALSKPESVSLSVANIKAISRPLPPLPESSHETVKNSSVLSLKSLTMSLRLLRHRGRSDSVGNVGMGSSTLETIDETRRTSVFKLDVFERNLKKFVSKSNEADFQSYSDYIQKQENAKARPKTYFKNQKVHDRRSSMSDINDPNQVPHPKSLQRSQISTSASNVKRDEKKKHKETQKTADKTAEMLKEVRKRNMETSKRLNAPRRISTY